jgi:hypothetical protein
MRDMARQIYLVARIMFGNVVALEHFRKLPSRCIAGRWMSIADTEDDLLRPGADLLQALLVRVLEAKSVEDTSAAAALDGSAIPIADRNGGLVDPTSESSEQYRARRGKWRTNVLTTVKLSLFWEVVAIGQRARAPLKHLHHFLASHISDEDASISGNHLSILALGKARIVPSVILRRRAVASFGTLSQNLL